MPGRDLLADAPPAAAPTGGRDLLAGATPPAQAQEPDVLFGNLDNSIIRAIKFMGRAGIGAAKRAGEIAGGVINQAGAMGEMLAGIPNTDAAQQVSAPVEGIVQAASDLPATATAVGKSISERSQSAEGLGSLSADVASIALGGPASKLLRSEMTVGRAAARAGDLLPPEIRHHEIAAKTAGLPPSETFATPPNKLLNAEIRRSGDSALEKYTKKRDVQSSPEWQRYRDTGVHLEQEGEFFTLSDPGINLLKELKVIEEGGEKDVTEFGVAMRKSAKKMTEAITGVGPNRPHVDLQVLDEQLRELRAKQYDTGPRGFNAVKRKRIGVLADKLEAALKKWVGPDNYPRQLYAELSKGIDKFDTDLGRAITGKETSRYGKPGTGPPEILDKTLAKKVFANKESFDEFKGLVGPQAAERFAERHMSNEFRGKTARQQVEWLESNQWVQEVPGAYEKALKHIHVMAAKERDARILQWLSKKLPKYAAITGAAAYGGSKVRGVTNYR